MGEPVGIVEGVALEEPAAPLEVARGVPLRAEETDAPPVALAEALPENEGCPVGDGAPLAEEPAL